MDAELIQGLRARLRCSAAEYQLALLVGSATIFPMSCIGDLDVVLLLEDSRVADVSFQKTILAPLGGLDVECTAYPYRVIKNVRENEELAFFFFREIRKLSMAVLIDGPPPVFASVKSNSAAIDPPYRRLLMLLEANSIVDRISSADQFFRSIDAM